MFKKEGLYIILAFVDIFYWEAAVRMDRLTVSKTGISHATCKDHGRSTTLWGIYKDYYIQGAECTIFYEVSGNFELEDILGFT